MMQHFLIHFTLNKDIDILTLQSVCRIFGGVKSNNYWIKKYANTYIELVTKTYKDIVIGMRV